MSGSINSSSALIYLFMWLKFLLFAFFVKANCGCLFSRFALFSICFNNFDLGAYTLQGKLIAFQKLVSHCFYFEPSFDQSSFVNELHMPMT